MPRSLAPLAGAALLGLGLSAGPLVAADNADVKAPAKERQVVSGRQIPVTSKGELTFKARTDADVRIRELWYTKFDGRTWGPWQRHGQTFDRNTPISWRVPEGHWKAYIRIIQISGMAMETPGPSTSENTVEFIVDRSAPDVAVTGPINGAFLRGGQAYRVTWDLSDRYLHSTPVTIRWSRGGDDEWQTVAEGLPNSGSYEWTTPDNAMTATGRLEVTGFDKAGNGASAESTSIVIDAIAPRSNILGPTISASRQVNLATSAVDAGPSGLESVQLWYSSDSGATWNEGPVKTAGPWESLGWQAPGDGAYDLALVAQDRSGNRSPLPSAGGKVQAQLLIDTTKPVASLRSPIGVKEADASQGAPLRRVYKPGDQVVVEFDINEANLPKGSVTVLIQKEEGAPWEQLANGLPANQPYTFTLPDVNSTSVRIKVQALDLAGNLGEAIASETFRIDNEVNAGGVGVDFD